MNDKRILYVLGLVLAFAFCLSSPLWAQPKSEPKAPVITHSFAAEKGYYGYIWKIYIEAEDPDGDMHKIVSTVDQRGGMVYFPDFIMLKPQYRKHLKGYLQWNTFSPNTSSLSEWTYIRLTVFVVDKAGNESNRIIFPFTFESGVNTKYELPDPFDREDLPRLGYIGIELDDPSLHDGHPYWIPDP